MNRIRNSSDSFQRDWVKELGIQGISTQPLTYGAPAVTVSGFPQAGFSTNNAFFQWITQSAQLVDNLSIIAVRWGDTYSDDSGLGNSGLVSTKTMPRDTVTTRLDEFGRHPNRKTDLSDEEIERAIEEIRSTIQKYSK